ncbi:MAG: hypothetical protein AB7Q42_14455 [Acidimicrobiia bacterium]
MPAAPSPLGRLVDAAFFAPIGFVCRLREQVPQLADAGRERLEGQVRLARMIGKLAVTQGRRELNRRLDEMAEQRRLAAEGPIIETVTTPKATEATTRVATRVATEPTRATRTTRTTATDASAAPSRRSSPDGHLHAVTMPSGPAPDAAALAISDYDSLAASQVVARLDALGPAELAAIGRYEAAKRGRRTILGKVQQLQAR